MSQPWWGQEVRAADVAAKARKLVGGEFDVKRPQLHTQSASDITAELRQCRPHFTPDWLDPPDRDAGGALVELFATQLATVARRLNRLPDKTLVDFLDLAGIQMAAARPSSALIEFTISDAVREPVPIQKGFQVGARPATGSGDLVVFETQANQTIVPAKITKLLTATRATQRDITTANEDVTANFAPLGEKPEIGDAMLIGLAAPPNVNLKETISFGIRVAAAPGNPPPVSAGGVAPVPLPVAPVLSWEALLDSQFQPVEVIRDETSNLWRSGIVILRVPPGFKARQHIGDEPLYWLRLRLIYGNFEKPPQLSFVRINMARVDAVHTVRDEVLEPIDDPTSNRMQLKNVPVVPKRLVIEVNESVLVDEEKKKSSARPAMDRSRRAVFLRSERPGIHRRSRDGNRHVRRRQTRRDGAARFPQRPCRRVPSRQRSGKRCRRRRNFDALEFRAVRDGRYESVACQRRNGPRKSTGNNSPRPRNDPLARTIRDGGRLRRDGPVRAGCRRSQGARHFRLSPAIPRSTHPWRCRCARRSARRRGRTADPG